jgi:fibronectin-binding autotransporter adhesin
MKTTRVVAPRAMTVLSASILAVLANAPAAQAQTTDTWSLGASGLWSVAGNWSAGLPGSTSNVDIIDGTSTVTLNISAGINDLTVGSGNTLSIDNGDSLSIAGSTISNKGAIQINGGDGNNGSLQLAANATLSGSGTITLATLPGGGSASIVQSVNGVTLTNQSTIQGSGVIGNGGLTLVSSGTIDGNTATGGGMVLNGNSVTNTGSMEATSGGELTLNTTVVNTGGSITASGAGSVVNLINASITGGTLTASGGGTFDPTGNTTLSGVTLSSGTNYPVLNGTSTTIAAPFVNNGTIQITGGAGNNAVLQFASNATLGGTVTLATATGGGNADIQQAVNGVTLTTTGTVQGAGIIGNGGLSLTNSGTIDANTSAGTAGLLLNGGAITNTGTLEATNGGTLTLNTTVVNTGANIKASGAGSVLSLINASITGGTLTASGGGVIDPTGSDTLSGVTIASGTIYPIATGNATFLTGPITNKGTIQINGGAGNNSVLDLNNNVTLAGTVTLATAAGGGNADIQQAANGVTLTTTGTVQGAGIIGNGGLSLTNSGTIDANTTAGTAGLLLNGGAISNTGLLEATNGGALTIAGTTVTNTGAGNITASGAGSVVSLSNASITGGTLTASGGGALNPTGSETLTGVTISAGTIYPVVGGTVTNLYGPITNNGTIQILGGNGNNSVVQLGSNVTLGGTVTLSTAAGGGNAYIQQAVNGVTLTNAGTTQGSGIIGNGGLALINETKGVIDANASGTGISTQLLLNTSGGITNTGLLEATSGNTLEIQAGVVNTNGNITASGTNSVVNLNNATVTGGTLNSSGGGFVNAGNSTTLNGVTISAGSTVAAANGSNTYLSGTTTNDGTFEINGGDGANALVVLNSNVTLTGGGKVTLSTLSGGGNSYIEQGANGLTLTNTNNTIEGSGVIGNGSGLTVVNSAGGTISSNVSGGSLVLNGGGGLTNSGTLQVSSGALMQVTSGPFTNFSGTTLTGGTYNVSGTLEVDELGTTGGEIVTDAANIILDGTAAKFVDQSGDSALTNLATIAAKSSFALAGDADFTTVGNFTNKGTLTVGAGSVFLVHGRLLNFSSTTDTLTAGTYDLTGKLEFAGANIETNDAAIELVGKTAAIINTTTKKNGLANFATNETAGRFTLAGGAALTTAGSVSNAGTLTVGTGSTLTVGGPGVYTQTAGTTTDNGTLAASGGVALSGGSLFAGGTITGNLASSGIVTPGASAAKTGILTDTGTYTQNSGGSLNIGIAGTTSTTFDAVKSTTAVLGGTLNLSELNSFIPTVGSTFKILTFNSVTGTFATVNGLTINSSEAYTVTYQPTDVLLTVVSTPAAAPARSDNHINERFTIGSNEGSRLTAALQEFNAAYAKGGRLADAGRNDGMAPRPRLERIRAMDLIKKGAKQ